MLQPQQRDDVDLGHVWYAAYGSNLSRQRFMCYIQGGTPEHASTHFPGCQDTTPPRHEKSFIIHHELYFADISSTWENGGVAFLVPERSPLASTFGRIYLITAEQFLHVLKQENGIPPSERAPSYEPDLMDVISSGSGRCGRGWYSLLVFLGYEENIPIFTFTSPEIRERNPPGRSYLSTIRKGLNECYQHLPESELDDYLFLAGAQKPDLTTG